jgi:hypothetical protein
MAQSNTGQRGGPFQIKTRIGQHSHHKGMTCPVGNRKARETGDPFANPPQKRMRFHAEEESCGL